MPEPIDVDAFAAAKPETFDPNQAQQPSVDTIQKVMPEANNKNQVKIEAALKGVEPMTVEDLVKKVYVDKSGSGPTFRLNAVRMISDLMVMHKSRKCVLQ